MDSQYLVVVHHGCFSVRESGGWFSNRWGVGDGLLQWNKKKGDSVKTCWLRGDTRAVCSKALRQTTCGLVPGVNL